MLKYECPNKHYSFTPQTNYIRLSISDELICRIANSNLKYSIIYKAKSISFEDYNVDTVTDSLQKFSESITFNTISNAKDIDDLKQKLLNLYNSVFL